MDLELVYRSYRNEKERIDALLKKQGVTCCPYCGGRFQKKRSRRSKEPIRMYKCVDCRRQYTPTTHTIIGRSHHTIGIWYEIIKLCLVDPHMSAPNMANILGVNKEFVIVSRRKIRVWLYSIGYVEEAEAMRKVRHKMGD